MAKRLKSANRVKQNTGLLIDGENVSAKKASAILDAAKAQGKLYEGKVYARQKDIRTRRWSDKARECCISDIRLYGGPEKNKVDNKIKKDARRLINQHKNIDIVCIATSDSDYVDIVKELRSMGKRVVVIGEKQAPVSLRTACNKFVEVQKLNKHFRTNDDALDEVVINEIIRQEGFLQGGAMYAYTLMGESLFG